MHVKNSTSWYKMHPRNLSLHSLVCLKEINNLTSVSSFHQLAFKAPPYLNVNSRSLAEMQNSGLQ